MAFNLASTYVFVIKPLISSILFLTALNAELVAKPVTLGILPSILVILALRFVFLPLNYCHPVSYS